jgi:hypothetical protein
MHTQRHQTVGPAAQQRDRVCVCIPVVSRSVADSHKCQVLVGFNHSNKLNYPKHNA